MDRCNVMGDAHVGPIRRAVGGRNQAMLVEVCEACGYEWPITYLSPRRLRMAHRALDRGIDPLRAVRQGAIKRARSVR